MEDNIKKRERIYKEYDTRKTMETLENERSKKTDNNEYSYFFSFFADFYNDDGDYYDNPKYWLEKIEFITSLEAASLLLAKSPDKEPTDEIIKLARQIDEAIFLKKIPTVTDKIRLLEAIKWAKNSNQEIHPYMLDWYKNQQLVTQSPEAKPLDDDIHPREKNTLLKIIAVMAKDGYNNDLSNPYGELSKIISEQADLLGISLDFKTVGEKLKAAKQFLPDSD